MPKFASVVLDVDSTLCGIEGVDWLAERCGGDLRPWAITSAIPFAMAAATGCGTIPAPSSMTMVALLIWSRNSTDLPPPRKTSLMSIAPV